jgi:hypothetical protein
MTLPTAQPGAINYELVDRFTLVHGAVGFVLGAARLPLPYVALTAIAWELIERPLKAHHGHLFPRGSQDSFQNAAGDALAMLVGWFVQKKIWDVADARNQRASAASLSAAPPRLYTEGR